MTVKENVWGALTACKNWFSVVGKFSSLYECSVAEILMSMYYEFTQKLTPTNIMSVL